MRSGSPWPYRRGKSSSAAARFNELMAITLAVLAMGLAAASTLQVSVGLASLARLGTSLANVRSGPATRLEGKFPLEVTALVEELNGASGATGALDRARAGPGR